MKRNLFMVLLFFILVLSACGNNKKEETKTKDVEQQASQDKKVNKEDKNSEEKTENDKKEDKKEINEYEVGVFKFSLPSEYKLKEIETNNYKATSKNESIVFQVLNSKHEKPLKSDVFALAIRTGVLNGFKAPTYEEASEYKEVDISGSKMGVQDFVSNTKDGKRFIQVATIATKNEQIIFMTATFEETKKEFIELIKQVYSSIVIQDSETFK